MANAFARPNGRRAEFVGVEQQRMIADARERASTQARSASSKILPNAGTIVDPRRWRATIGVRKGGNCREARYAAEHLAQNQRNKSITYIKHKVALYH
jgi:hypothetical protein